MKEQLVEFETAKLAKEVGFNEFCYSLYQDEQCLLKDCFEYNPSLKYYNSEYKPSSDNPEWFLANACSAPPQSLLQRWLYEKHQIWVNSQPLFSKNECVGVSLSITSWKFPIVTISYAGYDVYEVLEEGLQEALKLIKIKLN